MLITGYLSRIPRLRMSGAIPPLPLHAFMVWALKKFIFIWNNDNENSLLSTGRNIEVEMHLEWRATRAKINKNLQKIRETHRVTLHAPLLYSCTESLFQSLFAAVNAQSTVFELRTHRHTHTHTHTQRHTHTDTHTDTHTQTHTHIHRHTQTHTQTPPLPPLTHQLFFICSSSTQ